MAGLIALCAGFVLDFCVGDPRWLYHPICAIGNWIAFLEKKLRKIFPKTPSGEKIAGVFLVILVLLFSAGIPLAVLILLYRWNFWAGLVVETFWCYQLLAMKSLKTESMKVYEELKQGSLAGARQKVSMIVGRDTEDLSEEQVAKAAVETVAENTSDGTVAPLLFMAVGGAPLGFLYKGINTLDSMVGYKNEVYLFFGRFSAKLDDAANFIPARVSAFLMIGASVLLGMDFRNAWRIFRRDRFNHASPNSAQTEAVCAGALDIQLAGDAYYFGKLYPKKTIGDRLRAIRYEDIASANRLLYGTAALCLLVSLALRAAIYLMIGVYI